MLKRWFTKWSVWASALDGIDDPQGNYLLLMEKRLARLEGEVKALRQQPPNRDGRQVADRAS